MRAKWIWSIVYPAGYVMKSQSFKKGTSCMYEKNSISMEIHKEVLAAEKRIRPHIRKTDLEYSPYLSRAVGAHVHLKLECNQLTGSFKLRGALNKFLSLPPDSRQNKVITASSGNHGVACAYLLKKFGGKGVVYLPEKASPAKVSVLRQYGVGVELFGSDCIMSETLARETALKNNQTFISPYNDPQIIGGQGTIGLELRSQLDSMDTVLAPVGGGGLISGIATFLKTENNRIDIIGCQPENSAVMYESVRAGKIVEMESKPTIADGTAGGMEPDSITFDICREMVDDYILVTEKEIKEAIRLTIRHHQMLIEGAAALSVACLLKEKNRFKGKNIVLIISGKKISPELLKNILNEGV
jgi:threonine dehydratase